MDRSSKQKINKETQVLNDTLDEIDLIAIFRTFHPKAEEYTFFSSAHGTLSRINHILGHKSNLSKFKKIEIISSISNHNAMRLDINYKKETVRNTNTWASHVAWIVKNLPAMQETRVRSLGWEDPLEKGIATHSSILA